MSKGLNALLLSSYGSADIPLQGMVDEGMDVDEMLLKMIQARLFCTVS